MEQNQIPYPKIWPFGVLQTVQWVAILVILISMELAPFVYNSVGFVLSVCWIFIFQTFISWICHVIGVHRKVFSVGQGGFLFIPFAMIDFISSCLATLSFGISALICMISTIDGLNYRATVVITYLFATFFCLIAGSSYAYYAILVYRACPNGNLLNLMRMVIEGDHLASLDMPSATGGVPTQGGAGTQSYI